MEGELQELQKYILERALLPDGTPIFSARHFAMKIDIAKTDFPKCDVGIDVAHPVSIEAYAKYVSKVYEWFLKNFGDP